VALVLGAPVREHANVLQAPGEPVALALELLEAQQSRSAEGFVGASACRVDRDVRKGGCDRLRELALELGDLRTQRAACGALVEGLDDRCATVDRQLLGVAHASTPPRNAGRVDSTSAHACEMRLLALAPRRSRAPLQAASSAARAPHSASSA
jgi:hypothetical protein